MIDHEVIVIGDTISAHITASLLARKGINVGFVRKERKLYREIGNLWIGSPSPLLELANVLELSARPCRTEGLFVHKNHRIYRLPLSTFQMVFYSYLPFIERIKTWIDLIRLNRMEPEDVRVCTARDIIETLHFSASTTNYLLALGSFATCVPWSGMDAITFFSSVYRLRAVYPKIYFIKPGIEQFLKELKEIYLENEGVVYDGECSTVTTENGRGVSAILDGKSIEAKFFVLSTEPYELNSLLNEFEHPVLKEFREMRAKCLDVKIVMREKITEPKAPLVFEDAPLLRFLPDSLGIESGGRMTAYWRYFIGSDDNSENIEKTIRKFRVVVARAYPNFWSNIETIEHICVDVPLPYYKKLPQSPLRNLFIGTRNVYGNNLRDEVRAGIDAFMLCYRHLRK